MNKDFWERIDRLEELAGKATQGEWVISTSDGIDWGDLYITTEERDKDDIQWIATIDSACFRADETQTDFQKEQNANACYIAAANPAIIMEMIAELRRLEKEADWLASMCSGLSSNAEGCEDCFLNGECPHNDIHTETMCTEPQDWRESARKAVSEATMPKADCRMAV